MVIQYDHRSLYPMPEIRRKQRYGDGGGRAGPDILNILLFVLLFIVLVIFIFFN
jgi:hypothetical protein